LTDEQVLMCPDITGFSGDERNYSRIADTVAAFAQGPIGLCATAGVKSLAAITIIAVDVFRPGEGAASVGLPTEVLGHDGSEPRDITGLVRIVASGQVINAMLNPAIVWLGNRRMAFVLLSVNNSIIVDTAVTCIVLSLLTSLFVTPAAHREFRVGRLTESDTIVGESSAIAHLPIKA
jgi:NAD-dependent SIR2 family protein deacetylase